MNKNISIIIIFLVVVLTVSLYFNFAGRKQNDDIAGNALKCNQLYELKKTQYWKDEIGQSKSLWSDDLKTCLALNIYNDFQSGEYFASVIDMQNDQNLMWYSDTPKGFYFEGDEKIQCEDNYSYFTYLKNGEEIKEYGCDKFELFDKMFEKVRSFGFVVFDGFTNE